MAPTPWAESLSRSHAERVQLEKEVWTPDLPLINEGVFIRHWLCARVPGRS